MTKTPPLDKYVVEHHRWDWDEFNQVLAEIRAFRLNHDGLSKNVENGPEIWADLYWALTRLHPELLEQERIEKDHHIDRFLLEQLTEMDEFQNLLEYTHSDQVASANSCIALRPVIEGLWDKLKEQERLQQEIEQVRLQMAGGGGGGESDEDEDGEAQAVGEGEAEGEGVDEALAAKVQALMDELQLEQNETVRELQANAREALENAQTEAEIMHMADGWGHDPGNPHRVDPELRIRLAKQLNTPQFKMFAKLIGAMMRLVQAERSSRTIQADESIIDMDTGSDLSKVVPSELAKLRHPSAKLLFLRDWRNESLQQYEFEGEEVLTDGEIICCIDTSGSMAGEREAWAKAVGICLLNIAKEDNRGFYGIHFDTLCKTFDFGKASDYTAELVADFITNSHGGGTDFEVPLTLACDRLAEQYAQTGEVKGDIVFITDGLCMVSDAWLKNFKAEQARLGFRVWGVLVAYDGMGRRGTGNPGSFEDICDGRIIHIKDVLSGKDLTRLWREA